MKFPPIASPLRALDLYEPDPRLIYSIDLAARLTQVPRRRIALYYMHNLVSPVRDPESGGWYFNDEGLRTLRRIEQLREAADMNLAAIRMILDLTREVESLRDEVRLLRRRRIF